jgi:hypothetical protein
MLQQQPPPQQTSNSMTAASGDVNRSLSKNTMMSADGNAIN